MGKITESGTIELIRIVFMLMLCAGVVMTWATTNPLFHILIGVGTVGLVLTVCIFTFSEESLNP